MTFFIPYCMFLVVLATYSVLLTALGFVVGVLLCIGVIHLSWKEHA